MSAENAEREAQSIAGRREHVALLFSDMSEYTTLAEQVEPETVGLLKHELAEHALAIVTRHGGNVVQFYGDGILAVFGFAEAQEDTSRRALNAALELHECARNTRWKLELPRGFELRMHSGVHDGVVFGRPGNALHGAYDLAGDAVNMAARLCASAGRDEILVSVQALAGFEEYFSCGPELEISVKGKQRPITVRKVMGRTGVRTRFEARVRRGLTPFVGRSSELDRLTTVVREFKTTPTVTLLTGTAGLGKTRLLEEFRRRQSVSNIEILSGTCDNYSELVPLEPFLQILEQLVDFGSITVTADPRERVTQSLLNIGTALREHIPTFLKLLSLSSDDERSQSDEHAVTTAWVRLFQLLSADAPVIVMLDDWQWADDASRTLLASLAQRSTSLGKLHFLLSARNLDPAESKPRPDHVIELKPFDESESLQVIRDLLPPTENPELAHSLFNRSGGNALFLEELCRSLPTDIWHDRERPATIPATLQDVIHARVARLPAEQLTLLRAASVIGIEFTTDLLAALTASTELDEALDALAREDLIYASGAAKIYRFKHAIMREVIYATIVVHVRRALHDAVARLIEQTLAGENARDESETLAHHWLCAADPVRGARYSEAAGDKAFQQSSLDRARFHYTAALSALEGLQQDAAIRRRWLEISFKWAVPCAYSPTPEHVRTMERAVQMANQENDIGSEAQGCHWLGWFHFVLGNYAQSIAAYTRALELSNAAGNTKLVAQLWSNLGQVHGAAGEYESALQYFARGLALKKGQGRATSKSRALGYAHALACNALVHSDRGEFELVERLFLDALEIVRGTGHPMEASVLSQYCMALLRMGDWKRALDTAEHSIQVAERANIAFSVVIARFFRAYAAWMLSPNQQFLVEMQRACNWLQQKSQALYSSFVFGCMAEVLASSGYQVEAEAYAQRALQRAHCRDVLGDAAAYRALAGIYWLADQDDQRAQARSYIARAFEAATQRGAAREVALTKLRHAELLLSSGDVAVALAVATEARLAFSRMRMTSYERRAQQLSTHAADVGPV